MVKSSLLGVLSAAFVLAMPLAAQAQAKTPPVVVTPLLSAIAGPLGQPIRLPSGDARVIVSTFLIQPGARLPNHLHPYPRYAYVLQGKLRVTDVASGRSFNYKQGDFTVEVVKRVHFGVNTGTTPLKLLVMDYVPKAERANTVITK